MDYVIHAPRISTGRPWSSFGKLTMNPWKRPLTRCVCPGDARRCPMAWSFLFMLAPALAAAAFGRYVLAAPFLAISATSVAKYRFDALHAVDLWTVAVCVAAAFATNAIILVPYLCLSWNVAVFCAASHRSCWWHATIHAATGVALAAWLLHDPAGWIT